MANNPMTFTDPNGEDPFTAAIIIGAIIGAASYTANVAFSEQGFDNWNWGQFVGSVGVGAVSGAFTYGIGDAFAGVSNGFVKVGGSALAHGTLQGGLSELQGGSFKNGFASGALSSLATSAIQEIRFRSNLNKSLEFEDSGVEMDGKKVVCTKENARKFSKAVFGDMQGLDDLILNQNPNQNKYDLINGNITRNNKIIGGVTTLSAKEGDKFTSNVFLSKNAFRSKIKLYLTLGHEYVHVTHNYYPGLRNTFPLKFSTYTEHAAYKWTWEATNKLVRYAPDNFYFNKMNSHSSHFLFDWTAESIKHHKFIPF